MIFSNAYLNAAEIKIIDSRIVVNGMLMRHDGEQLKKLLNETEKIDAIVFENSPGGSVVAAFEFAELIKQRRLNTIVKGKCYSACAYAFLAGKKRTFDSGSQLNGIMLHVARTTKNDEIIEYSENYKIMNELDKMTGNKLPDSIKELIRKSWRQSDGVLIVSKNYYLFKRQEIMYCDGTQGSDASKCTRINDVDAIALGILTN